MSAKKGNGTTWAVKTIDFDNVSANWLNGKDWTGKSSVFLDSSSKRGAETTWYVLTISTPGSPLLQSLSQLR